ncbi:MAG: hypothetical protein WC975_11050 [Phycisphaerae bacterium]
MSILTANLKFFYQRRPLWVFYLFLSFVCVPLFVSIFHAHPRFSYRDFFTSETILNFFFGLVCASLWKDILGKPLAFCLPKNQRTAPKVILIAGIVMNVIVAYLFLCQAGAPLMDSFNTFVGIFFFGMNIYLATAILIFWTPKGQMLFALFGLYGVPGVRNKLGEIGGFMASHSLALATVGVGLGVFSWYWLGQRRLVRNLCLNPSLGMFDTFNPAKQKKFREIALARKSRPLDEWRSEKLENFFLSRMKQYDLLGTGRNLWAMLYLNLGRPDIRLMPILLIILGLVGFWTYTLPSQMQILFFVFPPVMVGLATPLPLKGSMLIPTGRRERFGIVVFLLPIYTALAISLLLTGWTFWLILYSWFPHITLGGTTLTAVILDPKYLYTPLVILPICFILQRFIPKNNPLGIMIGMMFLFPAGMFGIPALTQAGPLAIIGLAISLWSLCILVLRNYFQTANLVTQTKN